MASTGEQEIAFLLKKAKLDFTKEQTFKGLKDKRPLPFDFYVTSAPIKYLIEFDGMQHFEHVKFFGNVGKFGNTRRHDEIKNRFCLNNNIPLIRVPYWEIGKIDLEMITPSTSKYRVKSPYHNVQYTNL